MVRHIIIIQIIIIIIIYSEVLDLSSLPNKSFTKKKKKKIFYCFAASLKQLHSEIKEHFSKQIHLYFLDWNMLE